MEMIAVQGIAAHRFGGRLAGRARVPELQLPVAVDGQHDAVGLVNHAVDGRARAAGLCAPQRKTPVASLVAGFGRFPFFFQTVGARDGRRVAVEQVQAAIVAARHPQARGQAAGRDRGARGADRGTRLKGGPFSRQARRGQGGRTLSAGQRSGAQPTCAASRVAVNWKEYQKTAVCGGKGRQPATSPRP